MHFSFHKKWQMESTESYWIAVDAKTQVGNVWERGKYLY